MGGIDMGVLRGFVIAALVVAVGGGLYWMFLVLRLMSLKLDLDVMPPPFHDTPVPTLFNKPRKRTNEELLGLIRRAYECNSCIAEYRWTKIEDPHGQIVLAWREWGYDDGTQAKALDAILVKEDGSVETLGTAVELEVGLEVD